MRLQLDNSGVQGAHSAYAAEIASSGSIRSNGGSDRPLSDSVGLSGASKALQTAQASHADKLARLTQSVRAGTYSVSSQSISKAIIAQAGK